MTARGCSCSGARFCARCASPALRAANGLHPACELPRGLRNLLLRAGERQAARDAAASATGAAGPSWAFSDAAAGEPNAVTDATAGDECKALLHFRRLPVQLPSSGCGEVLCADAPDFRGIFLCIDGISGTEEEKVMAAIDQLAGGGEGASREWSRAQGGRNKLHWGVRTNFKKRKMKADGYDGVPLFGQQVAARTRARLGGESAAIRDFHLSDAFVLRYSPAEHSNTEFHVDDQWSYGEAILDLSMESDSVLTFVQDVVVAEDDDGGGGGGSGCLPPMIAVPLARRSIAVISGAARYRYHHAILAADVRGERTSVTLRCLGDEARRDHPEVTDQILERCSRGAHGPSALE